MRVFHERFTGQITVNNVDNALIIRVQVEGAEQWELCGNETSMTNIYWRMVPWNSPLKAGECGIAPGPFAETRQILFAMARRQPSLHLPQNQMYVHA
jgi:hypothetical protein